MFQPKYRRDKTSSYKKELKEGKRSKIDSKI
jgi:hypothetical protein